MHILSYNLSDSDDSDIWSKLSDRDKVINYFDCQFGNDITLFKVMSFDLLDDWCEFNHIDKVFVKKTIKDYKK